MIDKWMYLQIDKMINGWIDERMDRQIDGRYLNGQINIQSLYIQEKGVDINQVDDVTGTTPLMIACLAGHHDAVKVLLKNRADPLICDKNEWNSLHYAIWGMV